MMRCPNCRRPDIVVEVRQANYSAFSGYKRMYSDYSRLRCTHEDCRWVWRSKAAGVDTLPDAKPR